MKHETLSLPPRQDVKQFQMRVRAPVSYRDTSSERRRDGSIPKKHIIMENNDIYDILFEIKRIQREQSRILSALWLGTFLAHFKAKLVEQNHSDILLMRVFCVFLQKIQRLWFRYTTL